MSFSIRGLGTAVPEVAIAQDRAAEWTSRIAGHSESEARRLAVLFRRSGIRKRYTVLLENPDDPAGADVAMEASTRWRMRRYDEAIRPLACRAASRALGEAKIEPGRITHLVTASCTGFAAPGFDLDLIAGLGLSPGVQRTHVGFMGCHGALNALRVSRAFSASEPGARVLLCAAELCTLHFRRATDAEASVTNALFADGAAAVVGWSEESDSPWRLVASGSSVLEDTSDAMSWRIGDRGFEMTLSPRVAPTIGERLGPWLSGWLGGFGLEVSAIGSWAVHPGGPRVLDAVEGALNLDRSALEDSRDVLASCGNMSSPTILFILDRLRRRGAPGPCVAMAFGPGLTIEAALFA